MRHAGTPCQRVPLSRTSIPRSAPRVRRTRTFQHGYPAMPVLDPPMPQQPAPAATAWMTLLARGPRGGVLASLSNCLVLLGHDPVLSGLLAWDAFACLPVLTRAPPPAFATASAAAGPYPRSVEDTDVTLVQAYMQRAYDLPVSAAVAMQACRVAASLRRTHPVCDWLDTLRWDGTPRLDTWLHHALGTANDAYHAAVGARLLCGAVRRVRQPGCKFDYVPVLEGAQGIGKSRLLAELFTPAWFKDDLPRDLGDKDAAQGLLGVWCVELGELQALGRSTSRDAKAFFSRQNDRYRPSYAMADVMRPRQCVFVGTTNEHDYLTDPTGNRRYWPVCCTRADVAWVTASRDQLWAEACRRETTDPMPLWLDDAATAAIAAEAQEARLPEDPWHDPITAWLAGRGTGSVRMADVLHLALGLPRERQDRPAQKRAGTVLRAMGWTRHKMRSGSTTYWAWRPEGLR